MNRKGTGEGKQGLASCAAPLAGRLTAPHGYAYGAEWWTATNLQAQARRIHVSGAHEGDHSAQSVAVRGKQPVHGVGVACRRGADMSRNG